MIFHNKSQGGTEIHISLLRFCLESHTKFNFLYRSKSRIQFSASLTFGTEHGNTQSIRIYSTKPFRIRNFGYRLDVPLLMYDINRIYTLVYPFYWIKASVLSVDLFMASINVWLDKKDLFFVSLRTYFLRLYEIKAGQ